MKESGRTGGGLAHLPGPRFFQFDIPTLTERLHVNDTLALVIRAHLYVDSALTTQIESALANRAALDVAGLPFPLKVRLAVALGKIDPESKGTLTKLNNFRNDFAHKLEATELAEQDELDFYNTFSERQRKIADGLRTPDLHFINRLRIDLMALILAVSGAPVWDDKGARIK